MSSCKNGILSAFVSPWLTFTWDGVKHLVESSSVWITFAPEPQRAARGRSAAGRNRERERPTFLIVAVLAGVSQIFTASSRTMK